MTDKVVDFPQKTTKNRGDFFAIDRRVWATVCKARDINQGVAYLILARGTGPDHRSTGWSANAIEDRTGISRGLAKKAIADLVERGVVKDNGKHEGRGRYELLPPLEIPGCVVSGQALTVAEIALLKMLKDGAPKRIPKEVRKKSAFADVGLYPLKVALSLLDKGILRRVGPAKDQSFQVTGKAATIAM